MSTDQEILDHLNFGQAGADMAVGLRAGASVGASVGAGVGVAFPPLAPVLGAIGAFYGGIIGGGISFLNGLFTTDPAVTRRNARELAETMQRANGALTNMLATWTPTQRDVFIMTPAYQQLVDAARAPAKWSDTLGIIDDPQMREAFREVLREHTVSPEHPTGIVFGDDVIRQQVKDRILGRASEIQSGILAAPRPTPAYVKPLAFLGGAGALAALVWKWKQRRAAERERGGS